MIARLLSVGLLGAALLAAIASAQDPRVSDLSTTIEQLASFDYPVRTAAAQRLRRMPAETVAPALAAAVRRNSDQFVRFKALVLLTGFPYSEMPPLVRALMTDRNDRVREVAYSWLAGHPDRALTPALLAALQTEGAEFVRPALIRALASVAVEPDVQRALVAETGRGLDFFRGAAIEALGERRASFAFDAVSSVAIVDGPLQDDAVIALGRIGDPRASAVLGSIAKPSPEAAAAIHAARCLLGDDCASHIKALAAIVDDSSSTPQMLRAAAAALGTTAASGKDAAASALISSPSAGEVARRRVLGASFAGVALRAPDSVVRWLGGLSQQQQDAAVALLQDGFASLEDDYAEEQFFAAVRAAYWKAPEASELRGFLASLTQKLEF